VFLGARLRSGIDYLLDLLQVRAAIQGARLVVTGGGSLDDQTLRGKAPAGANPPRPVGPGVGRHRQGLCPVRPGARPGAEHARAGPAAAGAGHPDRGRLAGRMSAFDLVLPAPLAHRAGRRPCRVGTLVAGNEPGLTEWEDFASPGRPAAPGGITTILD